MAQAVSGGTPKPGLFRWFITDIDGTVTDEADRLHFGAMQEVRRLEDRGLPVGLVSGRPYPMVRMLGEYLGLSGPLIAENGGIGFYEGREILLGSREAAQSAAAELGRSLALPPSWDNAWRVTDFALSREVDLDALRRLIDGRDLGIELQVSSLMVHLGRRGATKGTALRRWAEVSGLVPDEILVAGDSDSDLSLFREFRGNLAPANCTEEIGRLAAYRALAPFGVGFCEGVEHFRRAGRLP